MRKSTRQYPAEFLTIWRLALSGELLLPFPRKGTAVNMRQRLYTYRKRLLEESPELAGPFIDLELQIEEQGNTWIITANLSEWKKLVQEQAKNLEPLEQFLHLASEKPSPDADATALSSTLDNLGFTSKST